MRVFPALLLLWGCTASQFAALQGGNRHEQIAIEELRIEVADLKHALNATEVELQLLEEKLEAHGDSKVGHIAEEMKYLERKVSSLEKTMEKSIADLRSLSTHANQTVASLSQYREKIEELDRRMEEVSKIKNTLSSLSKVMGGQGGDHKSYKVRAGDSLEKIARRHRISVDMLKKLNHLENDRIVIGQELKVPNDQE